MRCPTCDTVTLNAVIDSRLMGQARSKRRRRECSACGLRVTTYEVIAEEPTQVVAVLDPVELIDNMSRSMAQLRKLIVAESTPDQDGPPSSP